MLQTGGQAHVTAHDVDAVVVKRAREVQARLGGVFLQAEPLACGHIVGLHSQHVLRLADPPSVWHQLMGVTPYQINGIFHGEHLLLTYMGRAGAEHGPRVRDRAVPQHVCVPVYGRERENAALG